MAFQDDFRDPGQRRSHPADGEAGGELPAPPPRFLAAANALIAHNSGCIDKGACGPTRGEGELITLTRCAKTPEGEKKKKIGRGKKRSGGAPTADAGIGGPTPS